MAVDPEAITRKTNLVVHRIVFGFAIFLAVVVSVPGIWIILTENGSEYSILGTLGAMAFTWLLAGIMYTLRPGK